LSWKGIAASIAALVLLGGVLFVLVNAGTGHPNRSVVGATKGTVPPFNGGAVILKKVPDYISVAGRSGGIAGYIPKAYVIPGAANQPVSDDGGTGT
jgi:hypothetical protein